jgi:4-diphosphocytidyl-2-C-methyl-D-erythritol kinase
MHAISALRESGDRALVGLLKNDLEAVAVRLCPRISELREAIEANGAIAVGMSGSGPTVFGVFRDTIAASEARNRLGFAPPVRTWVANTRGSR